MAIREPHGHATHDVVRARRTSLLHEPFGIAQIFLVAMGVFYIVIGAVGLARTGFEDLTGDRTFVAGLGMTALLALIHLAIGAIAMMGATTRFGARSTSMFFGATLIALGIIALMQPIDELGWTGANGAAYLITGVIAIICAVMTRATAVREDRITGDGTTVV